MEKNKKKHTGLFVSCWILVFLLLIILFFVKKEAITTNLNKTQFFEKVFSSKEESSTIAVNQTDKEREEQTSLVNKYGITLDDTPKVQENKAGSSIKIKEEARYEEATGSESIKAIKENLTPPSSVSRLNTEKVQEDTTKTSSPSSTGKTESSNKDATLSKSEVASGKKDATGSKKDASIVERSESKVAAPTSNVVLYFVTITAEGGVNRNKIKRTLPKTSSPLTQSINELLKGPARTDGAGVKTLIPEGTKLLGASVKDGVATLNFSEEFEFNSVGVDGYIAQLMQVVYTATEYSTVKSVQILIDGEVKEYIGNDGLLPGLYIKTPLTRLSF